MCAYFPASVSFFCLAASPFIFYLFVCLCSPLSFLSVFVGHSNTSTLICCVFIPTSPFFFCLVRFCYCCLCLLYLFVLVFRLFTSHSTSGLMYIVCLFPHISFFSILLPLLVFFICTFVFVRLRPLSFFASQSNTFILIYVVYLFDLFFSLLCLCYFFLPSYLFVFVFRVFTYHSALLV